MGQLSSQPKKVIDMECIHERCILLKYTTNTAEKHPHRSNEMPVGLGKTDGGREEKKSQKSFWRRTDLHFLQPELLNLKENQSETEWYKCISSVGVTQVT